jgi:hypothetical protein
MRAPSSAKESSNEPLFGKVKEARSVGSRGACSKCGQVGHLDSQCRNFVKLDAESSSASSSSSSESSTDSEEEARKARKAEKRQKKAAKRAKKAAEKEKKRLEKEKRKKAKRSRDDENAGDELTDAMLGLDERNFDRLKAEVVASALADSEYAAAAAGSHGPSRGGRGGGGRDPAYEAEFSKKVPFQWSGDPTD